MHKSIDGFTAATTIPAIASAIKQAQREAADELHILAAYYHRTAAQPSGANSRQLTTREAQAARTLGTVMVEQGFNATVLFLAVNGAAAVAGPIGGMIAQVGITWNTIVTPQQTQRYNPARMITDRLNWRPEWVSRLPRGGMEALATHLGRFASSCGYGDQPQRPTPASAATPAPRQA